MFLSFSDLSATTVCVLLLLVRKCTRTHKVTPRQLTWQRAWPVQSVVRFLLLLPLGQRDLPRQAAANHERVGALQFRRGLLTREIRLEAAAFAAEVACGPKGTVAVRCGLGLACSRRSSY